MSIQATAITKTFGRYTALNQVDFHAPSGQLVALLGPSGSGKTTLLRILAGLEFADPGSGGIHFHDEDVTRQPAGERRVGFVFQHYALFRHMTVFENIAFGLRVKKRPERPSEAQIVDRVSELLRRVQLSGFERRFPSQLSGGQRQRVALARALAVEPKVLLLDEPFGALDAKVRKDLRRWLREFHDSINLTTIFVTHDQEEALEIADQVVVMNQARVEQVGSPQEVYDRPASPFVHRFLGNVNVIRDVEAWGRTGPIRDNGRLAGDGLLYVRPHDIEVRRIVGEVFGIPAVLRHSHTAGPRAVLSLEVVASGEKLEADISRLEYSSLGLRPNDVVQLTLRPVSVVNDYVI